jgi:hypothetical protein
VTVADRKSLEQLRQCLIKDGVSSLKMAVKNYCFLVKRLELGYVLYIIKHATKTDKDVFTKLLRTWKIYKVMRNQQCIFYLYLTDLLIFWLPKLKSLYLKKRLEKRLGNKLSFWRSNDNSICFVMTFLKSRSLKQLYNS